MQQYECHHACASVHTADTPSRTPADFGNIFDKKDIAKEISLLNLTVQVPLVLGIAIFVSDTESLDLHIVVHHVVSRVSHLMRMKLLSPRHRDKQGVFRHYCRQY